MKTYLKTLERTFKRHFMRFLSIIFIVVVSVGLISGIGACSEKIFDSLDDFYRVQNVSDFILKSSADSGFSEEQIDKIKEHFSGTATIEEGMSLDVQMNLKDGEPATVRLYFLDFANWTVNLPLKAEGKDYKELGSQTGAPYGTLCVEATKGLGSLAIGTEVPLDFKDILTQSGEQAGKEPDEAVQNFLERLSPVETTVAGIVHSPIAFTVDGEPSYIQEEGAATPDTVNALESLNTLDYILYVPVQAVPVYRDALTDRELQFADMLGIDPDARFLPVGDLYVAVSDRSLFRHFSVGYGNYVDEQIAFFDGLDDVEVITLNDNYSFCSLNAYSEKLIAISVVLLVAFVFVTALVVSSTMTRLMEEERSQIACLRTLGYSGFKIVFKYLLFALLATGIAGVASYFLGLGLSALVYFVFNYSYVMPAPSSTVSLLFYLITYFCIVGATAAATVIEGFRLLREKPAELLRPRPPKAGKKVFIERIPLLWNRLSFKYKSSLRNVLRYKNRFLMTVVSVACAMGLVLAGLALLDLCLFQDFGSVAIQGLAIVIVIFAGLLTMAVIYTLTNINISERNREIATLMVLGYYDGEVSGYIYREIYINTLIGIVFGYPVGVLLIWAVFKVMNFGTLGGLSWFMWLIAPFVVLLFTSLVALILRRKIVKVDMNESLKANE